MCQESRETSNKCHCFLGFHYSIVVFPVALYRSAKFLCGVIKWWRAMAATYVDCGENKPTHFHSSDSFPQMSGLCCMQTWQFLIQSLILTFLFLRLLLALLSSKATTSPQANVTTDGFSILVRSLRRCCIQMTDPMQHFLHATLLLATKVA